MRCAIAHVQNMRTPIASRERDVVENECKLFTGDVSIDHLASVRVSSIEFDSADIVERVPQVPFNDDLEATGSDAESCDYVPGSPEILFEGYKDEQTGTAHDTVTHILKSESVTRFLRKLQSDNTKKEFIVWYEAFV